MLIESLSKTRDAYVRSQMKIRLNDTSKIRIQYDIVHSCNKDNGNYRVYVCRLCPLGVHNSMQSELQRLCDPAED